MSNPFVLAAGVILISFALIACVCGWIYFSMNLGIRNRLVEFIVSMSLPVLALWLALVWSLSQ